MMVLSLILSVSACSDDGASGIVPRDLWTVTDGITLRLMQDSHPPGTAYMTVVLENHTDSAMIYGQSWTFEKYKNGAWQKLKTIENYGFTDLAYTLYEHDKNTIKIGTWFLKKPLNAGLYRITGCSLRVAPSGKKLSYAWNYEEYPPYQLEFTVSKTAPAEPVDTAEDQLAPWRLPEIEHWQWYTPWDCWNLYENAGMQVYQCSQAENGLMAVAHRTEAIRDINIGDLLLLDLFDRKTGQRYEVFSEPTLEYPTEDKLVPYEGGFKITLGDAHYYCFVNEGGLVELAPLDTVGY